ncbi:hypothetical protein KUTeg_005969 [Tegillarca granosa]|uniref:Trehalase n=1 Tax=Tegillarca granosa TaxID=220873 RepID=A0ABQ9FI40_TEGGR|nr:hypothetical protein KUTeg_005969 [Tegillarca granosa]
MCATYRKMAWFMMLFLIFLCIIHNIYSINQEIPACSSQIYCSGRLLDTIQRAKLFPDSKTFVDMNLKASPDIVLQGFDELMKRGNVSKDLLRKFVQQYFDGPGKEFETWQPSDYVRNPSFLKKIKNQNLQDFGWDMCSLWKELGRKIKDDVRLHNNRYSLTYLSHPFIVPGGRFREPYYWDSYWVIRGLLICEMNTTTKGMLENFFEQVEKLGHVPNGDRVYYSKRSQPPLLIQMVNEYYEHTKDLDFIQGNIDTLEKEYNFWMNNRNVVVWKDGQKYEVNHYSPVNNQPRPESYSQDIETAKDFSTSDARKVYNNLIAAAESGWDFSSRWFSRKPSQELTLKTIDTTDIIPVDLNSILCMNERTMAKFYHLLGNASKEREFESKLHYRINTIRSLFWNSDEGIWQDYSLSLNQSRNYFYPSNFFPMFSGCFEDDDEDRRKQEEMSAIKYLKKSGALNYDGGVPTSFDNTSQQWDYTNGWPPLQHVMIWALHNSLVPEGRQLAVDLASKWINSNWKGWIRTRNMFEKDGFGWTNGVVLDILQKFGDILTINGTGQCSSSVKYHKDIIGNCPAGCKPETNGFNINHLSFFVLFSIQCIFLYVFRQ